MIATSSRSTLGTSHSIVASQKKSNSLLDTEFPPRVEGDNDGKHRRVWRIQRSSILPLPNYDSDSKNSSEKAEDLVSSVAGSSDDSLSDAYSGDIPFVSSVLHKSTNLVLSGTPSGVNRTGRKVKGHAYLMPRHAAKKKPALYRNSHHPVSLFRNDSRNDSEELCRSGNLRPSSGASPLPLKQKKISRLDSSKLLRKTSEEEMSDAYRTPSLSTSSRCWYKNRGSRIIGSWEGTVTSLNDGDDHENNPLNFPGSHGCGVPCYWSKRTSKHRGVHDSCCSHSLSDISKRKGTSTLHESRSVYNRWHRRSSSGTNKRRKSPKCLRDAPLLPASNCVGKRESSAGTGYGDDKVYTNYEELELEALSRLDGMRWSNCRCRDGLDYADLTLEQEDDPLAENVRSLSQKYKPKSFDEIVGQKIVVHSLLNAVQRGRIAPVYLFQGPRGTGKTSLARIFAAALNCLTIKDVKPCCICKSCRSIISGKSKDVWEVDSTSRNGIYDVRCLLTDLSLQSSFRAASSSYKVLMIDECHLLPPKTWLDFLTFIEELPRGVVFIFITTDLDNVPHAIHSRCQKYIFSKIKDCDISSRLCKISVLENLDVESDAFDLIALNAGGSLRHAETMLDQLSLLGKRITAALVSELVGAVSDEKLLYLLELAMSSDTVETVKRTRELLDSGVDPLVLTSQLAGLIMDIIAGTYKTSGSRYSRSSSREQTLHEGELDKLKHALKLLSEAKKQLRVSSEHSTWFIATILQLGSVPSPEISQPGSGQRRSSKVTEEDLSYKSQEYSCNQQTLLPEDAATPEFPFPELAINEISFQQNNPQIETNKVNLWSDVLRSDEMNRRACNNSLAGIVGITRSDLTSLDKLNIIWYRCIERCQSRTLRFLLHSHGKLLSISEAEGVLLTYVAFSDKDIKSRVERFLRSITNSMEIILKQNVEVRLVLLPSGKELLDFSSLNETSGLPRKEEAFTIIRENKMPVVEHVEGALQQKSLTQSTQQSLQLSVGEIGDVSEGKQVIPMERIRSIIREQMLETAWLHDTDTGLLSCDDIIPVGDQAEKALDSRHLEEELNHELRELKVNVGKAMQDDDTITSHCPMSPSLLHCTNFVRNPSKDSLVSSRAHNSHSGNSGWGSILCWNNARSRRRRQVNGPGIHSRRSQSLSMFGQCMGARSGVGLSRIKE